MRAGVYARISSDREADGLGVARQLQDCEELAASKGHYVDTPLSAEGIDPVWENLKGDPRFERIYGRATANTQLQRKKVLALGLL